MGAEPHGQQPPGCADSRSVGPAGQGRALPRMELTSGPAMLATLGGFLALVLGLTILLLPLLVSELSRPRDAAWGAVVLLLGLVLVTSSERLTGAPMLAVLCGGLLIGRLGSEVAQGRWRALSDEERASLLSPQRWSRSLEQLAASASSLLESASGLLSGLQAALAQRSQGRSKGKRWVRADAGAPATGEAAAPAEPTLAAAEADHPEGAEMGPDAPDALAEAPQAARPAEAAAAAQPDPGPQPDSPSQSDPPAQSNPQPETEGQTPQAASGAQEPAAAARGSRTDLPQGDADVRVVADFTAIDALLDAAEPSGSAASEAERLPPQPDS